MHSSTPLTYTIPIKMFWQSLCITKLTLLIPPLPKISNHTNLWNPISNPISPARINMFGSKSSPRTANSTFISFNSQTFNCFNINCFNCVFANFIIDKSPIHILLFLYFNKICSNNDLS